MTHQATTSIGLLYREARVKEVLTYTEDKVQVYIKQGWLDRACREWYTTLRQLAMLRLREGGK